MNSVQPLISGLTGLDNKFIAAIALPPAILPNAGCSGVREAIAAIPEGLASCTEESVQKSAQAKEAVRFGLFAKHQEEADAMAASLNDAVDALEKKSVKPGEPRASEVPKTGNRLLATAGAATGSAALGLLLSKKKKEQ